MRKAEESDRGVGVWEVVRGEGGGGRGRGGSQGRRSVRGAHDAARGKQIKRRAASIHSVAAAVIPDLAPSYTPGENRGRRYTVGGA